MKLFTLTPAMTGTLHLFNEPLSFVAGVPLEVPEGYRNVLLAYQDGGYRFTESAQAPDVDTDAGEPAVEPGEEPANDETPKPAAKPAKKKK